MKTSGITVPYMVGTMIELPRAVLRAAEMASAGLDTRPEE